MNCQCLTKFVLLFYSICFACFIIVSMPFRNSDLLLRAIQKGEIETNFLIVFVMLIFAFAALTTAFVSLLITTKNKGLWIGFVWCAIYINLLVFMKCIDWTHKFKYLSGGAIIGLNLQVLDLILVYKSRIKQSAFKETTQLCEVYN